MIDADADAALRRTNAPVLLTLDAKAAMVKSRNVVAQTKTGDTHNVVVAGAHLDSVAKSPGINDNGTGVAALLETAAALGAQPQITNAVRFGFWGSEEAVLAGSTKYVEGLDRDQLDDIALYLNFDMLGSPNAGFFTYDGDQSGQPNPAVAADTVPVGSAGIERTLAGYLNLAGIRPADMPLGKAQRLQPVPGRGRPDRWHDNRCVAAENGGAGAAVGRHRRASRSTATTTCAGDTVDNVNRDALAVTGPGVAFAVGTYAQSIEGVNGVPTPRAAPPAYALATRLTNWYTPSSSGASGPGRACGDVQAALHRLARGPVLPVGQVPEVDGVGRVEVRLLGDLLRERPRAFDVGAVDGQRRHQVGHHVVGVQADQQVRDSRRRTSPCAARARRGP